MTKQSPNMKLSRTPGGKPKTALLSFGDLSWNIADGLLYAKGLNEFGDEEVFLIGGKFFDNFKQGDAGRKIELGVSETAIKWRYVAIGDEPDFEWTDLIKLSELTGEDGREIIISSNETHILWKYEGDEEYNELLEKHPTGYSNINVPESKEISKLLVSDMGHLEGVETRNKPAGSHGGPKIVVLTQTEFDQLNPPEHDTLYFIKDYILKEL